MANCPGCSGMQSSQCHNQEMPRLTETLGRTVRYSHMCRMAFMKKSIPTAKKKDPCGPRSKTSLQLALHVSLPWRTQGDAGSIWCAHGRAGGLTGLAEITEHAGGAGIGSSHTLPGGAQLPCAVTPAMCGDACHVW